MINFLKSEKRSKKGDEKRGQALFAFSVLRMPVDRKKPGQAHNTN